MKEKKGWFKNTSLLQTRLGSASEVGNFGASGSTVAVDSVKPYLYQDAFKEALDFQPTTVIIMLGTNDARTDVYPYINSFTDNYKLLIKHFQALESKPQIFLVIPPPVYENTLNLTASCLTSEIIPRIEQVAKETCLPLIDNYTPLLNHVDYFDDGVHPLAQGAQVIADTIYRQITLPP